MQIGDIARKEVITASSNVNLSEIANLMHQNEVGTIVIIDNKNDKTKLLGIITDRDITLKLTTFKERLPEVLVTDVMSKNLLVLNNSQSLNEAIIAMREKGVRRAPIVDEKGNLSGIISADDLLFIITNELCELQHLIKHQMAHIKCCNN